MLYYTEICLSSYEVPGHSSICIYVSGCHNRCVNCHYPLLQQSNYGTILVDNFSKIIEIYSQQATCVCFLGEGENTFNEHKEFYDMVRLAKNKNLKTCLYSGRDADIEEWMNIFDFVKVGSYKESLGGLNSKTTNQVFYKKEKSGYKNITYMFWG